MNRDELRSLAERTAARYVEASLDPERAPKIRLVDYILDALAQVAQVRVLEEDDGEQRPG